MIDLKEKLEKVAHLQYAGVMSHDDVNVVAALVLQMELLCRKLDKLIESKTSAINPKAPIVP